MGPGGKAKRSSGWRAGLAGAGVAFVVFVIYLRTLAPTVLGFERPGVFDSPMLQAEAAVLGVGHPTGYPTYMMLTHLFTYLPFGDVAYRTNLASALYAAAAVAVVYAAGLRLSGRIAAAAVGALAFGLSATFWSQAVIAEVYTLNALFIAAILFVLLLWRDTRRDRYLLLACFLMGLSLTHHLTSALLIPAGLAFIFLSKGPKPSPRKFMPKGAGLFLLGLVPYLYLPARAAMEAPLNEADPSTPGRFLLLVTGASFILKDYDQTEGGGASGMGDHFARLAGYWEHLSGQFPVALIFVGALGVVYLASTNRATTALLGIPALGSLIHGLVYGYEDYFLFLIPAYLVFSLWVAVGASVALRAAETFSPAPKKVLLVALSALMLAFPIIRAQDTYAKTDRSGDYGGRKTIQAVVRDAEPGATVLHHRSDLWYMVLVERRRRDLTLIDPFRTAFARHADIVWPDDVDASEAAARYGTDDTTGVASARIAAEKGAVYILGRELDQGVVRAADFREAGFDVVRVDRGGELYELIPPGP